MASIKSFETFVSEMDRSEEIETKLTTTAEPDEKDFSEIEDEAEEVQQSEIEDEDDEVQESEDKVTPIQGKGDGINPTIPVSEMLEKCYETVIKEAQDWNDDAHDDHTVETYMAENAALVARMGVSALTELKGDMETEAFEACLNKMAEAYTKKINESKEMKDAIDSEDI